MEFQSGKYLELFNPIKNNYFPVRILEVKETGISVKILSTGSERTFANYYLNNYHYRFPNISHELLKNCGFENHNKGLIWKRGNIIVVECLQGEIKNNDYVTFFINFSSRFLGYKVTTKEALSEFLELLKQTPFDSDSEAFRNQNLTVSFADELFMRLSEFGLKNLNTDKIILEC
jgi:hypothetical protein